MNFCVFDSKQSLSEAAAAYAAQIIRDAIARSGVARIVAATGASQLDFLDALTKSPDIDWKKIDLFQLDEYVGLAATHPASFTKYLQDRLVQKTGMTRYHALHGDADPVEVIRAASEAIREAPIDVVFAGIGENGHLAFNDPPADFATNDHYILVQLDEACRRQQVGEGWFSSLAEVPKQAISMSIRQILSARHIVAVVPDARKAQAVKSCLEGPISPLTPASILRTHANATIFLDRDSAALLSAATLATASAAPSANLGAAPQTISASRNAANFHGGK